MSRHYHDSDCTPAALESISDRLDELLVLLEALLQALRFQMGIDPK